MNNKIISYVKDKSILITLILSAFISFLFVYPSIQTSFFEQRFEAKDLKSNVVSTKEKYIDESKKANIFTYGPYINLKKGSYDLSISYNCDFENRAQITAEFGGKILYDFALEPGENVKTVNVDVDEDVYNKSVEIRTIYGQKGFFEIKEISLKYKGIEYCGFIFAVLFLIVIVITVILFKKDLVCRTALCLYLAINSIMVYNSLMKNNSYIYIAFTIALLMLFAMFIFKNFIIKKIKTFENFEELIVMVFTAYLISTIAAVLTNDIKLNVIDFIKNKSFDDIILGTVLSFNLIALLRITIFKRKFTHILMFMCASLFGILILNESSRTIYLTSGIILIIAYIAYYVCINDKIGILQSKLSYTTALCITVLIAFSVAIFFGYMTIYKYKTFSNSTYDFGIFTQMYEYMCRTGMPLTTVERNKLLSHFYIHFSPIYYTILPIYAIFRKPETLLMLQSLLVFSGSLPVFLICKKYKFAPITALLVSLVYIAYPGFVSPLYFDFHENKFLALIIMWFIYFLESKQYKRMYLFMILTFMIKEDAPLYIIFVSMYAMLVKKEYKHGIIMIGLGFAYFGIVLFIIQYFGMGLIDTHYSVYYFGGEAGFSAMVKNIITNSGFFVNNMFTQNTFEFIFYMIASLMFIPLVNKSLKNLFLLIPFVAINIMTTYKYQHNVNFQYCYGSGALLIYLFIINISEMKAEFRNFICMTSVIAGILFIYTARGTSLFSYQKSYNQYKEEFEKVELALDNIPNNVSITASTFLVPHLYDKAELYKHPYEEDNDYVVMQINDLKNDEDFQNRLIDKEYIKVYADKRIEIYKLPSAPEYGGN